MRSLNGRRKPYEAECLVDTGVVDCLAPADRLRAAGIKPEGKAVYELANGEPVNYEYGFARIKFVGCLLALIVWLVTSELALAQGSPPAPETTTVFLARHGQRLQLQSIATLHYLELFQIRRRWIVPDIGYIDFGHDNYREMFVGAGYTLYDGKRLSWIEEMLFAQAFGSSANDARYLLPWTLIQYRLTDQFGGETVYFPYFPLNKNGRVQHVLERAKLERKVGSRWKAGAGLGGYKYADNAWSHRPFLTTTVRTRWGDWEFWLQRLPGNKAQFQIRYAMVDQR